MGETGKTGERAYSGQAASGGVAHGKILRLGARLLEPPQRTVEPEAVESELCRLREAILQTRQQIREIQRRVSVAMGASEGEIFEAQLLVLDDPTLLDEITRTIRDQRLAAETAAYLVASRFTAAIASVQDPFFSERSADVRDVTQRLIANLEGGPASDLAHLTEPVILVAPDLSPSLAATLDRTKVLGFATEGGGLTGHAVIMARKLRIPAVVGLSGVTGKVHSGEYALLDGHGGSLIVNPTDATLYRFGQMRERRAALEIRLKDLRDQAAVTFDGARLTLGANIDGPDEVGAVRESGAEGVGLFRTEFLFLNAAEPPNEEQQYAAYRAVAESLKPAPVVIRTLDLGGDKLPGGAPVMEQNPFLGWRAIRISLAEPKLFRAQLRAILRASAHGNVKVMYPMISSLDELLAANQTLDECRESLRREGLPFDPQLEVGMMVEIPSAALIAPELAPHVSFFSLGTNDLTQYTLAVDRLNQRVAPLHRPTHPAVMRLIQMTAAAAKAHGRWVGVCGETAGDPAVIPLLVGLGVDELSVTPALVPAAKFMVRRLKREEAEAMAQKALALGRADEVLQASRELAKSVAPELFAGV